MQAGVNGWVCDAVDVPALTQQLDDLAGLAGNAAARAASRQSVAHLTLTAMAERLLALYRSLGEASAGKV